MRHHLLLQHITDDDKIRRQEFGIWFKQNEALVSCILWTDEAGDIEVPTNIYCIDCIHISGAVNSV